MRQRRTIARLRDVAWVLAPFGLALLVGAIVLHPRELQDGHGQGRLHEAHIPPG
jgi:hypothetical protein